MIVATIQSIISIRQYQARRLKGLEKQPPPKFVFEGIKREDAEVNLPGLLKYLVNYGYYKFGFEMCLIALVSLMTFRRDIIAMIYCTWLLVLLSLGRHKCKRVWRILEIFIFVSLLVQYLVTLGVPPSLCIGKCLIVERCKTEIVYICFLFIIDGRLSLDRVGIFWFFAKVDYVAGLFTPRSF